MKLEKRKKDIPKDVFIIKTEEGRLSIVNFNSKIKLTEMLKTEEGVYTFESKVEANTFACFQIMKSDLMPSDSLKESVEYSNRFEYLIKKEIAKFEKESKNIIKTTKRKKTNGRYNEPIYLWFTSIEKAHWFKNNVKIGELPEEAGDAIIIKVFKKSKGSITNKLRKFSNRGHFKFKIFKSLIKIN